MILGRISVSVDGAEYGLIEPPVYGGFASEANNLQSLAGDRWKEGTPMAPLDKEVSDVVKRGVQT